MKQKKAPERRNGIAVHCAGSASPLTYTEATGWNVDAQGILAIAKPSGRFNEAGQELGETIAAFKDWQRVGWSK
jgi:hypothetical protein